MCRTEVRGVRVKEWGIWEQMDLIDPQKLDWPQTDPGGVMGTCPCRCEVAVDALPSQPIWVISSHSALLQSFL